MEDINNYLNNLSEGRQDKLKLVIDYIYKNYPDIEGSCNYAPKTKFPMLTDNKNYVAIASQKSYISIHFSNYDCPSIVADENKKIKIGVGCAKIPDNVEFPIDNIIKAISICFS